MTFLCTVGGALVAKSHPWPEPWAFRCDWCGTILPYGCTLAENDKRHNIDEAREFHTADPTTHVPGGRHQCGRCEGWADQIGLGL
jgi:hypothetical protein